ncbi:hypothetical protein VJI72_04725 [Parvimonas micra]|uniref:hypothetical protein n=1 Tax=Parvimonas micra TaxID=33033 RepID=UPI002B4A853F|nr:hypothetical protein [Parvimonas micra]MEB3029094.1 hypothetical protein [Parvimonas micra]
MPKCKVISGLTAKTTEKLVLDAGAFFKNYKVGTDTFETAVTSGKLLGATKGGGSFTAVPSFRNIEIDGLRGEAKGTKILETWEIKLGATVVEVTPDTLQTALAVSEKATEDGITTHEVVKGKMCITDADYIENITWVGNLSGSEEPVIIQVYNALNTKGLELGFEDKSEATIELEFTGHFDMKKANEVPFKIYYPKITG